MRLNETKKPIASFLIFLIITIPFYIANATAVSNADTVNVVKASGEGGVSGFRKRLDTTKIEVEVLPAPAREVKPAQLKAVYDASGSSPQPFSFCSPAISVSSPGKLYACTFSAVTNTLNVGTYDFLVCGIDCQPCNAGLPISACRKKASVTVDNEAPHVVSKSVTPAATNGGDFTLTFTLTDSIGGGSAACSGLGVIDVVYAGKPLDRISLNTPSCNPEAVTKTYSAAGFPNGNNSLCIFPRDSVGNMNTSLNEVNCLSLPKDDTPPSVSDVQLLDPAAKVPLNFISAGTPALLLSAFVASSPYVKQPTVTAIISKGGSTVATPTLSCIKAGTGAWNCTSSAFTLAMPASASVDITVTAKDDAGNEGSTTTSIDLNVDTDQGQVQEVGTQATRMVNNKPVGYIMPEEDNTLYAVIQESGAGFAGNQVFFATDAGRYRATCERETEDSWYCENNKTRVDASRESVAVRVEGKDDAGQPIVPYTTTVYVDGDAPELVKVVLANEGPENAGKAFFLSGDSLVVKAYFVEKPTTPAIRQSGMIDSEGYAMVSLDLSRVTGEEEVPPEDCVEVTSQEGGAVQEGMWMCLWRGIIAPPKELEMQVFVADMLGNAAPDAETADFQKDFYIEYKDPATDKLRETGPEAVRPGIRDDAAYPNCWQLRKPLVAKPSSVDAQIASIMGHNVWYDLAFDRVACVEQNDEEVRLTSIAIDPTSCMGDTKFISSATVVTPSPSSPYAHLKLTVAKGVPITQSELTVNCALSLVSSLPPKAGQLERRISQPEIENFTATIKLHRLKAVDDAIIEEIKNVKGVVENTFFEIIDILDRIVTFINSLCNILFLLNTVNQILATVRVALIPCGKIPFCSGVEQTWEQISNSGESIYVKALNGFYKICQFISCRSSYWYGNAMSGINQKAANWVNEGVGKTTNIGGRQMFGVAPAGGHPPGYQEKALFGSIEVWGNPKNSLILSILQFCLPGIIFNIKKMRQIECQYLQCLASEVPSGADPATCVGMRAFGWCMFVYGEIFQIIPFASFIKKFLNNIVGSFKSVWGIVGLAMGVICWAFKTPDYMDQICRIAKLPETLLEFYNTVKGMVDANAWGFGANSCNSAIDKANEVIAAHEEAKKPAQTEKPKTGQTPQAGQTGGGSY